MGKSDENYTNILLEDIREQMKAVLEITTDVNNIVSQTRIVEPEEKIA